MTGRKLRIWTKLFLVVPISITTALGVTGCRSAFVEADIQNHTGKALSLLEVDYPSASFGTGSLAADATFHYRFKIQGSGPVKLSYSDAQGKNHKFQGPELTEGQEGSLLIVLQPANLVDWHPSLVRRR
jgi:hypothetical protein